MRMWEQLIWILVMLIMYMHLLALMKMQLIDGTHSISIIGKHQRHLSEVLVQMALYINVIVCIVLQYLLKVMAILLGIIQVQLEAMVFLTIQLVQEMVGRYPMVFLSQVRI